MMKPKNIFHFVCLTTLICITSQASERKEIESAEKSPGAAQAQKTEVEQWVDLKHVGEEIFEQKKEILLTPAKALELFQKEDPKFKADWLEKLGQPVELMENAREMPNFKGMMKKDGKVFLKVMAFSKHSVQIMILQPKGGYLWHHYEACLANFKIPRNVEIDKLFELEELDRIYSLRVKGIGYGSRPSEVVKVLGKPDGVENFQKVGMFRYYYLNDDLTIFIDEGIARLLTPGVPEWVKKQIKETGVNVTRRMDSM